MGTIVSTCRAMIANRDSRMEIRRYSHQDLGSVVQVFTRSVHGLAVGHYDAEQLEAWAPTMLDLEAWEARLNHRATLVAAIDGELAGFVCFEFNGHIDLLYTSPAHSRSGVASALLRHAESELQAAGVDELLTEASLAARPFFEGNGFQVEREETVLLRGLQFRRYVMRKSNQAAQPGAAPDGNSAALHCRR